MPKRVIKKKSEQSKASKIGFFLAGFVVCFVFFQVIGALFFNVIFLKYIRDQLILAYSLGLVFELIFILIGYYFYNKFKGSKYEYFSIGFLLLPVYNLLEGILGPLYRILATKLI